jgi:hypothetical protein
MAGISRSFTAERAESAEDTGAFAGINPLKIFRIFFLNGMASE